MNRSKRNFIIGFSALFTGVAAYMGRGKLSGQDNEKEVREKVLAFLQHPAHAAAIGRVYRFQYPDETTNELLIQNFSDRLSLENQSLTESEVERGILKAIQEDFENNQTVIIDGWILSRTEAVISGVVAAMNRY